MQKESIEFDNTATLTSQEVTDEDSDSVLAPFGKTIDKSANAFDRESGVISWKAFFNGRGVNMPAGTTITDTYDENLIFDTTSLIIKDEDNNPFTDYVLTPTPEDSKFTITFPNGLNKKVIIEYDTKIKDGFVIDGSGKNFENNLTFGTTTATGSKWVGQGNGVKTVDGIDIEKREIDYTIEVNKDKYQMKNLVITDSFDFKGLELIDGRDPVVTYKTNTLDPVTDYTFEKTDDNGGFKITLLGDYASEGIDDILTIKFTAKYDPETINDGGNTPEGFPKNTVLRNTATVDFKVGDKDYQSKSTVDTPLDETIVNNGKKEGEYDPVKKEITWGVHVNYNGYTLNGATVIDELEGDQNLILDSIKLYEFSVDAAGVITIGDEVNEEDFTNNSQIVPNGQDIVSITLPDGEGRYYLEFKTSLAGEIIAEKYSNTAKYKNGNHEEDLKATVTIPNGGKLVTKEGRQGTEKDGNSDSILWEVNINSSRSTVENVVITDEQTNNVIIDQESFNLYKYIYDTDQKKFVIDRANPLVINEDYTITFSESEDGKSRFELKFIGDYATITDEFRLEYASTINAEDDKKPVTNNVKFSGENTQSAVVQETTKDVKFDGSITGGAVGSKRSITVHKLDSSSTEDNKIYLEGATLKLVNSKGKQMGIGTTDPDGKIIFKGLVSGNYKLFEITPPKGYHASKALSEGLPIRINATDTDLKIHEAFNDQNNVIITKLNVSEDKLSGAKFKLEYYDESEEAWLAHSDEVYTTVNGKFEIPKLEEGKYRLIETSAPNGYILNLVPLEFTINEEEGFIQEHDFINYQGNVKLTKYGIDSDNEKSLLEGAIFELYKVGEDELIGDDYPTSKEGILEVTGLAPGDYYFIEKSSSDGFIADKNPINFTIASEFEGEPDLIELEANNYKANVSFNKVDSYGNPMDNVIFELQKFNSQSESYETIDTYTSIEGVVQVSNLSPGDYQFIETETVEGFILNTEPIKFTVGNSIMDQTELTITLDDFVNHQGKIAIEKRDVDSKKLIDGAKFSLYTSDDKLVEKNITTKNGKIVIEKLAPGKYYIVETKAPSGYIKSEKQFNFEIVAEFAGQPDVETIKITNKEDALPIVGVDSSVIALLLITISSLVGLRYYYRNN